MVSIIIPTYRHLEDCLRPCLESIIKYTDLSDVEILVVANGCGDDGTREYVHSLGRPFKLIWIEEPAGYTRATNVGIKAAQYEHILLLNNDTILLPQRCHEWIDILLDPFNKYPDTGATGPIKGPCAPSGRDFIIFFCCMTRKSLIEKIGYLDEIFTPGGGEDCDACSKLEDLGYKTYQVPMGENLRLDPDFLVGSFPIYHKGEATVAEDPKWTEIFTRNSDILRERYNKTSGLGNNGERAVIGKTESIRQFPREMARYSWARAHIFGSNVFEIGTSSGFGLQIFKDIPELSYTGVDYSRTIIDYATEQYGDIPGVKFIHSDINSFKLGYYDTIVAFEVLEHISNGRDLAQTLKKHAKRVLISVPYKEPVGAWGIHHKLHGLTELDFPGFKYFYMNSDLSITESSYKIPDNGLGLLLMLWDSSDVSEIEVSCGKITAYVCTKDRYFSTLPLSLASIGTQSRLPDRMVMFDDGEHLDLREFDIYRNIFEMFRLKGIRWEVIFGERKGQVLCHQKMLYISDTDFIYRYDDDEVLGPGVVEGLAKRLDDNSNFGAVSTLVIDPKNTILGSDGVSSLIQDIHKKPNAQWARGINAIPCDHLYSTFMYRKKAAIHGYCLDLSPVGHREETLFTHTMYKMGWDLFIDPSLVVWHYRNPEGGIRTHKDSEYWDRDEKIFERELGRIAKLDRNTKYFILNSGMGDHVMFRMNLPEIKKRYSGRRLVVACCYPEIFEEDGLDLISIAQAQELFGNIDCFNVYRLGAELSWNRSMVELYRRLYL